MTAALGLPLALLFLHPLPIQPDEPPVSLRLCRAGVTPCQRAINLPVGARAAVDIFVEPSPPAYTMAEFSAAAWYFQLSLEDPEIVDVSPDSGTGLPFKEQGGPGLALNGWEALASGSPQSEPARMSYHRFRNSHDPQTGALEYGVVLLGSDAGAYETASVTLQTGNPTLITRVTLTARHRGETRLLLGGNASAKSGLVVYDARGRSRQLDLAAEPPLFQLNVGPDAEKTRLEGRAWTELPGDAGLQRAFTGAIEIEIREAGAPPHWQEGSVLPVARFTDVVPASDGTFTVPDLTADLIPTGGYDLRAKGKGTLSLLVRNVSIDTLGEQSSQLPHVIEVDFGPFTLGDLSGDNLVDRVDLALLKDTFGTMAATSGANTGDFNDDGVVDGQDFSLMAANFGRRGE